MKKVIITGASGFLGNALTEKLLLQDVLVYGISSNENIKSKFNNNNFIPIVSKFEEYNNLPNIINTSEIDIIFHCAWLGTTSKDYQDISMQIHNISVVNEIINLAVKTNCEKIIYIGSAYQNKVLECENTLYNDNIYGIVKNCCEDLLKLDCIKNNIKFNCIKFTTLYGIGDYSNRLFNNLIKKSLNNISPSLTKGDNLSDYLYIDDAVNGIISVQNKGINLKSYYIGSRKLITFKEIVLNLFECVNKNVSLNFGEFEDNSYIDYSRINLDELYSDTGFECQCDFKESIIKTANWIKENDI